MFKMTKKAGITMGLGLLVACTVVLAADNHSLLNPGATNEFDLPNGGYVVEAASTGFMVMAETSEPMHKSKEDCNGTTEYDADGNTVQGGGFCTVADKDHDAYWVWWAVDADGGTWGIFAGTGKYEGATGGGTWEVSEQWPDGKYEANWRGEINLK